MAREEKRLYFDELSSRWDGFTDHDRVRGALRIELDRLAVVPDVHVIDLGCGTGNLTAVLLERLGAGGTITAVDFSEAMVARARGKFPDARVKWCVADAAALPLMPTSCDYAICFSAWPHFVNPLAVLREMNRVLRLDGSFVILHIDSREKINQIHSSASPAIMHDLLSPAADAAALLPAAGFAVEECDDSAERYCVRGRKVRSLQ